MPVYVLFAILFVSGSLFAQSKSETITIKESPFVIKKTFKGRVFSSEVEKIKITGEAWAKWVVEEAAAHGTAVKKGDLLIRFKSTVFDAALIEKRRALETQELNLIKMRKTYEINLKKMNLELEKFQLGADLSTKESSIYKDKGQKQEAFAYKQQLVDTKLALEYQMEELNQLEKMYKADNITEETEEIVVKRQRNAVKRMKDRIKAVELLLEQALSYKIPQSEFTVKYKKQKALNDNEVAKLDWMIFAKVEKLKLDAAEASFKKASKKLNDFVDERKNLKIYASKNGVVFYGSVSLGKWSNKAGTVYKKGTVLPAKAFIFSLINPEKYSFEAKVDLGSSMLVDDKASYFLSFPGADIKKLKLISKADTPDNGLFKTVFEVTDPTSLFHGIDASVQLISELSHNAVAIPKTALKTEKLDPTKEYVFVIKNKTPSKVYVKTGPVSNNQVLIKEGLKAGDIISK
jgi:HlyD family secretion protein